MLNLSILLEDSARKFPDKDAFIFLDKQLTYSQINGAANQIANGLKSIGIQRGDKVALSCPNLPFFPMAYYGILKAGAVVVPLSVLLKRDEIEYHLSNSDAKAYLCFEGTPQLRMGEEGYAGFQQAGNCAHFYVITGNPAGPSPIEGTKTMGQLMAGQSPHHLSALTNADDTAVIIYTSGTTGKPKGAELTHNNLLLNAMLASELTDLGKEDIQLLVLPLFHIFGMTVLLNAGVYKGATNVLLARFDADDALRLMAHHKVSLFAGVPTMYWALMNNKNPEHPIQTIGTYLKHCISGGASLPLAVLEGFEQKFGVAILEGYGMSEGSPVVTFNNKTFGTKPGSIGTPFWGVEVKIVDPEGKEVPVGEKGELIYKGHNVMKGYYKNPEANAQTIQNGWLHSGDVAVKDEDGFFFIVDRTKDLIIRGGFNIYPREVEELMIKHEAVSLVAVIGVPHEELGEEIKACVVLHPGVNITEAELVQWTKERIAAYKYPRIIEFMESLPMSATGKILKKELRK